MTHMTTKILIACALTLQALPLSAQLSNSTFGGLPPWAESALHGAGLDQQVMLSSQLNPVYAVGDFDRDGLLDMAVEVKDRSGLRCGIAILHRIDGSAHLVGAGRPVGNGKVEVSCRGGWGMQAAQFSHREGTESRDLLYVLEGLNRGGWLVWNGTTYVWVAWD